MSLADFEKFERQKSPPAPPSHPDHFMTVSPEDIFSSLETTVNNIEGSSRPRTTASKRTRSSKSRPVP